MQNEKVSRDFLTVGRFSTILLSWFQTHVKEEKLSFVYLKEVYNLFLFFRSEESLG
jgi:hypothetical protein